MRLFLTAILIFLSQSMQLIPLCYKGLIYEGKTKPYNISIPQEEPAYACTFKIFYAFKNFTTCQLKEISVWTSYETGTIAPTNGMCSFERNFWNNRYLKCLCSWDECNSHLQKIRPIFDELRENLQTAGESHQLETDLIDCLEDHLEKLNLLPPRISSPSTEESHPFTENLLEHWVIWLSIVASGLVLFVTFICVWKKCSRSKSRSTCWNMTKPPASNRGGGSYMPVAVRETFHDDNERPRTL